jgi:CRP/FNR family transcriptional regulator, dissimilatory nitrate respiration regulator
MWIKPGQNSRLFPPKRPIRVNVAEILDQCRLFRRIQPEGFAQLVAIARIVRLEKDEQIFRERDECPGVYVVGTGLVRVYKSAATGKEHVLHMVGPGNAFAEVAAIAGFRCPASAQAVVPTVCALLPGDAFRRLLEQRHELCKEMLIGLTLWVRQLVELLEDVVLRDAIGRLARFLLDAPTDREGLVELPALKRHVASHLNLTSETLSRTLRRLIDAGLIAEAEGSRFRVVSPDRLQMVADGKLAGI